MAYESPIRLITELENKIIEDQREGIYKAVLSYRIDIGKDELFQLLYGDRKQYEKGFADGRADAIKHGRWVAYEFGNERWHKCSVCGVADEYINSFGLEAIRDYCPNCGAIMDESTIGQVKVDVSIKKPTKRWDTCGLTENNVLVDSGARGRKVNEVEE